MVINKEAEIEECINIALKQNFNDKLLKDLYEDNNIESYIVDLKENPIFNESDVSKERCRLLR